MKQSNIWNLNLRDFLRGLLMATLTPAATFILNSIDHGEFTLNRHLIYLSAVGGALAYLLKNLATKPDYPHKFGDIGGGGIKNPPPPIE